MSCESHCARQESKMSETSAMICQKCGKETFLPFKCQYCGGYFCSEHRLPENHNCPQMALARMPKDDTNPEIVNRTMSVNYSFMKPETSMKTLHFSMKELEHLAVATVLVVGVGLSLELESLTSISALWLFVFALAFTASFLAHEIAHKIVAQRHGLWAEFRLTTFGAILTALSILPIPLKFIAPGAVMVAGAADQKTMGETAIAGPTVNILLAITLASAAVVWEGGGLGVQALIAIAWFNAWIATFNLIPYGIFDGLKVFSWDKRAWALSFVTSLALTVGLGIVYFGGLL